MLVPNAPALATTDTPVVDAPDDSLHRTLVSDSHHVASPPVNPMRAFADIPTAPPTLDPTTVTLDAPVVAPFADSTPIAVAKP